MWLKVMAAEQVDTAGAPTPDRTGRLAQWVTERFNEWPEGSRDAALDAQLGGGGGGGAAGVAQAV